MSVPRGVLAWLAASYRPGSRPPPRPDRGARLRARLLVGVLLLGYGLLIYRLHTLQVVEHADWADAARRQHVRVRTIDPERGRLLLQDGERRVAAVVSVQRHSLLVEGRPGRDVPEFLARLERALPDLSPRERAEAERRLRQERAFYLRRRRLTAEDAGRVRAARLPRVTLERESVRAYAYGGLAAQVLGLVGADHRGGTGVERWFDADLLGTPGRREVAVDSLRRELVTPGAVLEPARPGADVVLSIDRSVQAVAEAELARTAEEHQPQGAAAVVVDVATGDVLALASWPAFDPGDVNAFYRGARAPEELQAAARRFGEAQRMRAVTDTYEPGSTIKPLLVGTAWELGLGAPERPIDCPRTLKVPGRRKPIEDSHTVGSVTELEVLVQSSNTGAFKITARLSPEQIRRALAAFGLGRRTGVPLPSEAPGDTRLLARLHSPTNLGSVAQGYAVSVTPLQMALAYAALANGGTLLRPRLVREVLRPGEPQPVETAAAARPLSAAVAGGGLRDALAAVVASRQGTARRARSERYAIAGKTGTTKMLVDGRYHEREIVGSFCGFAPAEAPRIAFSVVVWGPNVERQRQWGGTTAAPCAGRIAEQALQLLRVPPSAPEAQATK